MCCHFWSTSICLPFFCWRLLGLIPGGTPFSQLNKGVRDAMSATTKRDVKHQVFANKYLSPGLATSICLPVSHNGKGNSARARKSRNILCEKIATCRCCSTFPACSFPSDNEINVTSVVDNITITGSVCQGNVTCLRWRNYWKPQGQNAVVYPPETLKMNDPSGLVRLSTQLHTFVYEDAQDPSECKLSLTPQVS